MRPFKRDGGVIKRNGPGKLGCCCAADCAGVWGNVITLTLSGVISCGCIPDGFGGARGLFGTLPSEIEMHAVSGTSYASLPVGSANQVASATTNCDDGSPVSGTFSFSAYCDPETRGLTVDGFWADDFSSLDPIHIFHATFTAPGTGESNGIACGGNVLWGGGAGSV